MRVTPKQYAAGLLAECQDKPRIKWPNILDEFFALLVQNSDLAKWPQIEQAIADLDNIAERRIDATVVSGRPIAPETLAILGQEIMRRTGCLTVNWQETIDKKLIGGAIIRYGDQVMDLSLAGSLGRLGNALAE